MIQFILNEKEVNTHLPPGTLLLDYIRYHKHLTGTKIGCREGDCGACTVLIGELTNGKLRYRSATSCLTALGNINGKHIVTIEGLNMQDLNPVQQLMCDEAGTQCGFCTPGFVVSMAGFCLSDKEATKENAIASIDGNICRCTGYKSIERAAYKLADLLKEKQGDEAIDYVTSKGILPAYFATVEERLKTLNSTLNGSLQSAQSTNIFLGGGTDLYVQKHDQMPHSSIDFLFNKQETKGIRKEGNNCIIGGAATVTDMIESPVIKEYFPQFAGISKLISSTPIRNIATIAGNFINASPIGDLTILFLALDAVVLLNDGTKTREVSLRKLYKGYKQLDKQPNEFVQQVSVALPGADTYFNFEKICKRTTLDIASVNTAINITMKSSKIAAAALSAGGVGPIPAYLSKSSALLVGKELTEELILELCETAQQEIAPISDARGSVEYKRLLLSQLIKAHFIVLFPTLKIEAIV